MKGMKDMKRRTFYPQMAADGSQHGGTEGIGFRLQVGPWVRTEEINTKTHAFARGFGVQAKGTKQIFRFGFSWVGGDEWIHPQMVLMDTDGLGCWVGFQNITTKGRGVGCRAF
jgi:hypothetical protein